MEEKPPAPKPETVVLGDAALYVATATDAALYAATVADASAYALTLTDALAYAAAATDDAVTTITLEETIG